MEDEKIIILKKPVTLGSGDAATTITELKLREPTAGEIEKASSAATNIGTAINLISLVAKVPRSAVEKLSQTDFTEANDFLSGFTGAGRAAGLS